MFCYLSKFLWLQVSSAIFSDLIYMKVLQPKKPNLKRHVLHPLQTSVILQVTSLIFPNHFFTYHCDHHKKKLHQPNKKIWRAVIFSSGSINIQFHLAIKARAHQRISSPRRLSSKRPEEKARRSGRRHE